MTIPATPRRSPVYIGNGVATSYAFGFTTTDPATIVVTVADADNTSVRVLDSGEFTVTLNPDQNAAPGGEVTYADLPVGHRLVITSDIEASQPTAITNLGAFHAHVLEQALDRIVMLHQQQQEQIDRSVKVDATSMDDETADALLAAIRADRVASEQAAATAVDAAESAEGLADAAESAADRAEIAATKLEQRAGDLFATQRSLDAPRWLRCDGAVYLRSSYPALPAKQIPVFKPTVANPPLSGTSVPLVLDGGNVLLTVSTTRSDANGGIQRSVDGGATWSQVSVSTGVSGLPVATDGAQAAVVWTGNGSVIRTGDAGASWSAGSGSTGTALGVATDGDGLWLALVNQLAPNRVQKSVNGGASWTGVSTVGLPTANPTSGAICSVGDGVWVITSGNAIYRSTDDGTTWVGVSGSLAYHAQMVVGGGVILQHSDSASAGASSGALIRSEDGGATWTTVLLTSATSVRLSYLGDGVWLVGSEGAGNPNTAAISTDGGLTWTPYAAGTVTVAAFSGDTVFGLSQSTGLVRDESLFATPVLPHTYLLTEDPDGEQA